MAALVRHFSMALALGLFWAGAGAAERFSVDGAAILYDTETGDGTDGIVPEDVDTLIGLLRDHPDVTILRLNSSGGGYFAAFDMADAIIDFELNTEIVDVCTSACAYVFLGGVERRMARGARLGFHRTWWSAAAAEQYYGERQESQRWASPFDFVSWTYEDTQAEVYERLQFMVSRGVAAGFAIETLRAQSSDMWYPYRLHLLASGVLTH